MGKEIENDFEPDQTTLPSVEDEINIDGSIKSNKDSKLDLIKKNTKWFILSVVGILIVLIFTGVKMLNNTDGKDYYDIVDTIRVKKNNLREVVKIELKLVIICMIIAIIGFRILRVPSAIFIGFVCGILDILPYVGTIIVFIPIIIYNIIMKEYLLVVGLIALYLLLQVVREILELKFLSSKLDIHPLVVMLSMYIGAEVFGIIGLLIGPIYCLIAKDIIYEGTL